jgi:FkbM family methyltransferase
MLELGPQAADGVLGKGCMVRIAGFNRLRSALAPLLRPVFEHIPPARWVAKKLIGGQPAHVTLEEMRFAVHQADFGVTLELNSTGDYEPATRKSCLNVLAPGMVFFDIGAHIGLFSLPAAKVVGDQGVVHAFEPDPINRSMLENNVLINGVRNVHVHAEALSDTVGHAVLSRSYFNSGDHRLGAMSSRNTVDVETVTVDHWCERHGLWPDVIKMDVQGAEPKVIAGMRTLIERDHPLHLFIEFTPSLLKRDGVDPVAFLDDFIARGFDMHLLNDRDGTESRATTSQVMAQCPRRSYVNLRVSRGYES